MNTFCKVPVVNTLVFNNAAAAGRSDIFGLFFAAAAMVTTTPTSLQVSTNSLLCEHSSGLLKF